MRKISTIAELMVKISGDGSGLQKELNKVPSSVQSAFSTNPVNAFTDSLSGATSGIEGMIGKISGIAALTAGGFGLASMVQGAVDAGESVYQMSTKMKIGAGEATELSRILKLTGGDTGTFATAMMRLDKSYTASGEAGNKCRAVFDAVGISLKDGNGKLLPLNQQLEQLSKGYQVAATSGQQEEFIMNTLGVRGMSLVNTLKNYNEAKEAASRVQGVGLDPAQMHELGIQLKTVNLEASQIGLAFTSALAPVAQELFPPIMSGLQTTATFLSQNKSEVINLTKDALELAVAYKSIQLLSSAGNSIATFWQNAAIQAQASMAATGTATATLTAQQEKAISRAVAASNKAFAKMETDAIKAASQMGLSAEEYANVVSEKSVQISTEAATAAENIRARMTEAYLSSSTAGAESAASQIASIERVGVAATEMNTAKTASTVESAAACTAVVAESSAAQIEEITSVGAVAEEAAEVKTAATTESAEACTAVTAESSATQVESITAVGDAATLTGERTATANAEAAESTTAVVVANDDVALSHATAGDAAVLSGEKTVGAMVTAEAAVVSLTRAVWTLIGGWVGLLAIMGYAAYKSYQYGQQIQDNYKSTYGTDVPVNLDLNNSINEQDTGDYSERRGFGTDPDREFAGPEEPQQPEVPQVDLSGIGGGGKVPKGGGGAGHGGKSDAEKELEKLQKEAEQVNKEIDNAYQEVMDNKIQKVDDWYNKEKEKLDASKDANSRYDEEVGELDTVYAEKHRKAYAEMLSNSTNIWIEAAKSQRELNDLASTAGLEGPTKDLLEMQNKYNDSLKETEEEYKKLSVQFMGMDTESQTQYLLANKDVTKNDDGSLNFTERINKKKLALAKNYELQKKNYHTDEKQWEHDLDKAYSNRSMSELQSLLNSDAAIQAQYRAGQTAAMKEYYDLWTKTHRTSLDEMAEEAETFDSGLVNIFTDIGKGVNSAGDLIKSFGSLVLETIWKIQAERLAANITTSIFGTALGGTSGTISGVVDGIDRDAFGFAGGGLLFGPGTGTSDSILMRGSKGEFMMQESSVRSIGVDNLNYMNETGRIPGYATGGLVTGPSLASVSSGYGGTVEAQAGSSQSRSTGGVKVIVNNNSGANVTAKDGGVDIDGIRQVIIDIVPDAMLDKVSRSPVYARDFKTALG